MAEGRVNKVKEALAKVTKVLDGILSTVPPIRRERFLDKLLPHVEDYVDSIDNDSEDEGEEEDDDDAEEEDE